jgi:large subunit ribosomal protein L25
MEEIVLKAVARSESPKKVRDSGFIPGVLNGPGTISTSVQFNAKELNKIIASNGANAKIWIALGDKKDFGFVKEIQRHNVERNILHVAIQLVSKDQVIKMQLPISYLGRDVLEHRQLQVQVFNSEVEVEGITALIPDGIVVDVAKKELGDNITASDFSLNPEIKILDSGHEIYAVIRAAKVVEAEEAEESKPAAVEKQ